MNIPSNHRLRLGPGRWGAFTLIELLVVIAIILGLVALLLPGLSALRNRAKRQRAIVEARQIATGIQGYNSDVGHWPFYWDYNDHNWAGVNFGGAYNPTQPDNPGYEPLWWNYRTNGYSNVQLSNALNEIQDLPLTAYFMARLRGTRGYVTYDSALLVTNSSLITNVAMVLLADPWGNPYMYRLDMNDDGAIPNPFQSSATSMVRATVLIWSAGPDGTADLTGENSAANRDNIKTW